MIGIMNAGGDSTVEFYASARQSSLYDRRKISKDSRTYNMEGRVFVNGVPLTRESPEDMWQGIIQKVVTQKIILREVEEKSPGRLSSVLRRLSSKLRPARQNVEETATVEKIKEKGNVEPVAKEAEEKFVTMIRVNTVDHHQQTQEHERTDGILQRLWEERSRLEEVDRGHRHDHSADSGHVSLEESTEVAVQRL